MPRVGGVNIRSVSSQEARENKMPSVIEWWNTHHLEVLHILEPWCDKDRIESELLRWFPPVDGDSSNRPGAVIGSFDPPYRGRNGVYYGGSVTLVRRGREL